MAAIPEWHGRFLPTTIGNLWREACYGGTLGHNDVFIWRNFGLPHPPLITLALFMVLNIRVLVKYKSWWIFQQLLVDSFVAGTFELFVSASWFKRVCDFLWSIYLILQVWLLGLVVLPARSHIIMQFGLVVYLTLLSIWVLPKKCVDGK